MMSAFRRLRGVTCVAVIATESAYWQTEDSSNRYDFKTTQDRRRGPPRDKICRLQKEQSYMSSRYDEVRAPTSTSRRFIRTGRCWTVRRRRGKPDGAQIARSVGHRYVYIGNIHDPGGQAGASCQEPLNQAYANCGAI
jgi:hypothetical protein